MVLSQVAGMSPDAEADKAAEKSPVVTEGMDAGGSVKITIEMSSAMVCNKLINYSLRWSKKKLFCTIRKRKMAANPLKKKGNE